MSSAWRWSRSCWRSILIRRPALAIVIGVTSIHLAGAGAVGESVQWVQVDPAASQREGHAMAYDSARGVTVLFGGWDGNYDDETWEWDGNTWTLRATTGPSPRYFHAMAFDSIRAVCVLFGGLNGSTDGQTWEWFDTTWTLRTSAGPSPRYGHAMAYDTARGVTVLFGGWDNDYSDETWEWEGDVWTLRTTATSPSPRWSTAMAYDSARGVTVLFGGIRPGAYDGETWEWDGQVWTLRPTTGPSPRYRHAMAYDSVREVILLFGGHDGQRNGETWEWDGDVWTLRSSTGPSPRANHATAFDSARQVTVLFGGWDDAYNGDTWEWPHCRCPADLNGDDRRDGLDLQDFTDCILGSVFGQPPSAGCECVDADGDGLVTANEVATVVNLMLAGQPCPCRCPADLNGDDRRDGLDLQDFTDCILGSVFGQPPSAGCECVDADGDGLVTANEVATVVNLMLAGQSCP